MQVTWKELKVPSFPKGIIWSSGFGLIGLSQKELQHK